MLLPFDVEQQIFHTRAELDWFEQMQVILSPYNAYYIGSVIDEDVFPLTSVNVILEYRRLMPDGVADSTIFDSMVSYIRLHYLTNVAFPPSPFPQDILTMIAAQVTRQIIEHMQAYGSWRLTSYL
jgi:hypothetical protein